MTPERRINNKRSSPSGQKGKRKKAAAVKQLLPAEYTS